MKEFRFLDQKRQTTGLSAEESARYAQLRDLVGPETGTGAARAGFDVGAAAARLRESLLPGGLRGAPPAPPPEPIVEAAPDLEVAPEVAPEAVALEAAWNDQPFAPLDAAPEADPLFDPASLGAEVRPQAWNPEAPGYDPDAPYDEAAWIAAGYDPNATYDWSAYGDADGQPAEAAGAEAEPPGAAVYEGDALAPAASTEEAAAPAEYLEEAAPAVAGWEASPGAEPIEIDEAGDPLLEGGAPAELLPDATLELQLEAAAEVEAAPAAPPPEPEPELPFDPNAPFDHAKWFGRPPAQPAPAPQPEPEPLEAEPEPAAEPIDLAAEALAPQADWAAVEVPAPVEILEEAELEPLPEPPAAEPPAADLAGWSEPEQAPSVLELSSDLVSDGAPGGQPWTDVAAPAPDPVDPIDPLDLSAVALEAEPPEPILLPEGADLAPAEAEPGGPVGAATPESWFDATSEPPPAPALAFGDYDADAKGVPAGLAAMMAGPSDSLAAPPAAASDDLFDDGSATPYQPAPAEAPFGEYDESAAAALPFDPAAASAIEPGEVPVGYDAGAAALDDGGSPPPIDPANLAGDPDPAELPPAPLGAYDDAAYGGPEGDSLPGGTPLELGEPVQDWQPEQALEQGFELASDGSFGELERPALTPVPSWAHGPAAPAEGWESPPALDLAAPFDLEAAPAEELPTLGGEDILEAVEPAAAEPLVEVPPEPEVAAVAEVDEAAAAAALAYDEAAQWAPPAAAEPEQPLDLPPEPALEAILEPVDAAPPAFEPPPEVVAPAWEPPPPAAEEELPPEIAAAFGDGAATPPASVDPFAAAAPAWAEPEPVLPPLGAFAAPPAFEPPPASLFSEPPPVQGLSFGAGEPEPVLEEAPLASLAEEPEPLPEPAASPQVWIEGSHRVVLHTVDGQVKRGLLVDAALDALDLLLQPQGPGVPETVPTEGVKAIFFMLAPGEKAATPEGRKVRVTFRDGRQVAGYSPDYQEGTIGFFMIPADTRTNTGRIWVYQAAVRQVAVS